MESDQNQSVSATGYLASLPMKSFMKLGLLLVFPVFGIISRVAMTYYHEDKFTQYDNTALLQEQRIAVIERSIAAIRERENQRND